MATRPECIQDLADLLGETFVTMENHARSMGPTPGRYSTKIGRGNRNVDLEQHWIGSTYLAALHNDPKSAASGVPALGDLKFSFSRVLDYSVSYRGNGLSGDSLNRLFQPRVTETTEYFGDFDANRFFPTLFDLLTDFISAAGLWWANGENGTRPSIPEDLNIHVTLGAEPKAVVSFRVKPLVANENEIRIELHYLPERLQSDLLQDDLTQEDPAIPFQRTVTIPYSHILRLGKIYGHTLIRRRVRAEMVENALASYDQQPKNEKADNLPGSSAPSETLSHTTTRNDTDMQRKDSLTSSDPSARVCVSSRGLTPKGRFYERERTSSQHALL